MNRGSRSEAAPDHLAGFGNALASEALEGALPRGQNSPRRAPYGLYAEQVNGTCFTVPRAENLRSWLYRIRPGVERGALAPVDGPFSPFLDQATLHPEVIGWQPRTDDVDADFVRSLEALAGAGDDEGGPGLAIFRYRFQRPMADRAVNDRDGDCMLLPAAGALSLRTEFGDLRVEPGQFAVVPRGLLSSVDGVVEGQGCVGFVVEVRGRHFGLPERGVIGANGLADERHFAYPTARWEDREVEGGFEVITKFGGRTFASRRSHSPFDVVAWHGRYVPYSYDLRHYNAVGTVTWDHPDPSIFTVLSAPLYRPGENLADLVVFPRERWEVAEHTFRPPFYHRNAASEFNMIVAGPARKGAVFSSGGCFYTPPFAEHGVSASEVETHIAREDAEADRPVRASGKALWLQIESVLPLRVTASAVTGQAPGFRDFATGVRVHFDPTRK